MPSKIGKANSYPLRLPVTMQRELKALAKDEGISVNQFINLAVAEKIVRCQQRSVPDQAANVNSPTLHEFTRRQHVEADAPSFAASFELESAQHHENLAAFGMPVPLKKSAD